MKNITLFAVAALFSSSALADTSPVHLDTFANRAAIELNGTGPFHQVALPLAVYQGVQQSDLGDLRVFNAQGEVVPYALLRKESQSVSKRNEVSVPLFPIVVARNKSTESGDLSVEVRKNADGTLVSLKQSTAPIKNGSVVQGVVLDASKIKNGVRSLRLNVGPSSEPFVAYSIETSDDLQQWRMLKSDAQLVRMEHDGQRIERTSVEWDGDAGKYLRVMWADPDHAPAIKGALVGTVQTSFDQAPRIWSTAIAPVKAQDNTYLYNLPGRLPLEQIRISLPQTNTLTQMQIQHYVETRHRAHHEISRHREEGQWETLANEVVYRLQSPQGEVISPEIGLYGGTESRLQLVADKRGGGVGTVPPTLQVGFVPHTLVFLARGNAPFSLAWGAPSVESAVLNVATLVPGYSTDKKLSASPATLKLSEASDAANATSSTQQKGVEPASKGLLWGVLIVGLLVLGGMAAMLVKQMKQGSATRQE
jgi:hypothetical protein